MQSATALLNQKRTERLMEGCLKPKQSADLKDNEHETKTEFDLQMLWAKQLLCTATISSVTRVSPKNRSLHWYKETCLSQKSRPFASGT